MTALVRYLSASGPRAGVIGDDGKLRPIASSLAELWRLSATDLQAAVSEAAAANPCPETASRLLAPIDAMTPLWAAGVTYLTSRDARMEESDSHDVYERVYDADRPELFFKAHSHEVVTSGDPVGRRSDSTNDTPEPELAVVANSAGEIVAYGVANDMSSRSIEGENPLYLPQAKMYPAAAVLAPTLRVAWEVDDPGDLTIEVTIRRRGATAFAGSTPVSRMKRGLGELVSWLTAESVFPDGVILSTGTCVVPPLDSPTVDGDEIEITIDSIGTTTNTVTATQDLLGWWRERLSDATVEFQT